VTVRLAEVTTEELIELRGWYLRDLRQETQASHSVKRSWQIVIAALNEVIKARNGGALPVLDATKMCRPGDEPLA
jgi:hypothetical protein